jgi:tRNA pseudouridine13 synthase
LGHTNGGRKPNENDFQGAIGNIQRNLRLMYVHAYQSLVWNTVAGRRWELFGNQVVEGDLIVIDTSNRNEDKEVDDSGEIIVRPSKEDRAVGEDTFTRARPLTEAEAKSGAFSIWDIVLPLPGFDVEYPKNEIGDFYAEFMSSSKGGGLDPQNMRRKWKDISLSGGYRKLLAKPQNLSWDIKSYIGETDQLVETDLERILQITTHESNGQGTKNSEDELAPVNKKLAVVLKMQLGSSQYATMALREMLKAGGLKPYMAEFSKER